MHPAFVRLPAVVALATSLIGYPALAFATPPSTATLISAGAEPADPSAPAHDMSDMEGMDHGEADTEPDEPAAGHDEHGGSTGGNADATPTSDRPRAAVLSTFVGLNAAVLVTAAVLRRRDRDRPRHRPRPAATPTAA
ncbi:hypothetical protein HP550_00150 [Cellulomonas humilata]|uniref:Uncharacterized protein n=1 Tax=Cellulomonas humilata TaxID=144055 RepID=A0A7Y5ZX29_9CELL|nr:hypothetical protein [Cellulomonas humilata]NUU15659.1 hypothetical protein [Cellulomonas humilata]